MNDYDPVLTRRWAWHEHTNDTLVWQDVYLEGAWEAGRRCLRFRSSTSSPTSTPPLP
ncbi:MAG TPA: hypothetical protein VH084_29645 [Mycobacterium sp.]|jgi:hypothetical protein|nr:hypothetical protein [Mycobacterium sp.]